MCNNIIISVMKETSFVVNVQFLEFLYEKKIRLCISQNKINKCRTQKFLHCVIFIFFKNSFSPYCCEINLANRKTTTPLNNPLHTMESCLRYHLPLSVPAAGSGTSIWPWLKLTNPRKQWVPSSESLGLTACWRRRENLFYAFPRLCKQRIQRVAFLIGFTSMRTSNKKNRLEAYFCSFLLRWDIAF